VSAIAGAGPRRRNHSLQLRPSFTAEAPATEPSHLVQGVPRTQLVRFLSRHRGAVADRLSITAEGVVAAAAVVCFVVAQAAGRASPVGGRRS